MSEEIAEYQPNQQQADTRLSIQEMTERVRAIQQLMDGVMEKDVHYGVIPGTGDKPTLLKPGAEKICVLFRLSPTYDVTRSDVDREGVPDGHREYEVRCTLTHIPTGDVWGQGVGLCSTMEKKYRYRRLDEATDVSVPKSFWKSGDDMRERDNDILKDALDDAGVSVPSDAYVSATKEDGQWVIAFKVKGENPDIADSYNTVLKMAKKRAHVDAVLTATAASDFFTQDVEDMAAYAPQPTTETAQPEVSGAAKSAPSYDDRKGQPSENSAPPQNQSAKYEKLRGDIKKRLENAGSNIAEVEAQVNDYIAQWPKAEREKAERMIDGVLASTHDDAGEEGKDYTISEKQVNRFHAIASEHDWSDRAKKRFLKREYGLDSSSEIEWREGQYEEICERLEDEQLRSKYERDPDTIDAFPDEASDELPFND